ncbi:putative Zn-finger domain protein [Trypanosoma vivax]|nr:putative Zn-finger domain protein [Trypanosoma vivax]
MDALPAQEAAAAGDSNNAGRTPEHEEWPDGVGTADECRGGDCWICRDSENTVENPLLTNRCLCRGSIGWVHRECIDLWVFSQRRTQCPSCHAHYNIESAGEEKVPSLWSDEVRLLLHDLIAPLMVKAANILLGLMVNGLVVAFLTGAAFYHRDVLQHLPHQWFVGDSTVSISSGSTGHSHNKTSAIASVYSDGSVLSIGALFNISPPGVTEVLPPSHAETAGALRGFWLWCSVMLFGWICTTLWRCTWTGWKQWWSVFRPENVAEVPKPQPFTLVERVHSFMDVLIKWTGCSYTMLRERTVELSVLMPFAYILSFPCGKLLAVVLPILGMVVLRFLFERKTINDCMRRFEEANERKHTATDFDIIMWFVTYIAEIVLFSFLLPISGGIVVHFAVSPYLAYFPVSVSEMLEECSLLHIFMYWFLGTVFSLSLMHTESKVIVNLFAPGVDLFFIRSMNLSIESDAMYWDFILAQVFDADPLRVLYDFSRMAAIDLVVLYFFLSVPLQIVFGLSSSIASFAYGLEGDVFSTPLPSGFPSPALELLFNESESFLSVLAEEHPLTTFGGLALDLRMLILRIYEYVPLTSVLRLCKYILQSPTCLKWLVNGLVVVGMGTAVVCLQVFPIQWTQLRVLHPVTTWLARYVVHMEDFLFDRQREALLNHWLRTDGLDELPMPQLPVASAFIRRERALPQGLLRPKWLKFRLIVFSFLFLLVSGALFWVGPMVIMALLLPICPYSVPLVCLTLNLLFLVANPKLYYAAMVEFVLLCIIFVLGALLKLLTCVRFIFSLSQRQLVRETVEFAYRFQRTVGAYREEVEDADAESG